MQEGYFVHVMKNPTSSTDIAKKLSQAEEVICALLQNAVPAKSQTVFNITPYPLNLAKKFAEDWEIDFS